jgi:hypothetical protein
MGSDASVSVIRQGHGLLSGRLRCGRCGRKLHVRYWGKSGTAARYLCDGDFGNGGTYCIGFGGATVDRRFSELLLDVISPYGIQASLEAVERLNAEVDDQSAVHGRQLEQLEYEARRAFEQYDEADPRNRLVAAELERRWNEKLEELDRVKKTFQSLADQRQPLTRDEEQRLRDLGASFREVWESDACPMELKKKIVQTVIEEIVVNLDEETQRLHFVIHWKGGRHTGFEMDKPRSGVGRKTDIADVELIREMADRYEDGEIARVLNIETYDRPRPPLESIARRQCPNQTRHRPRAEPEDAGTGDPEPGAGGPPLRRERHGHSQARRSQGAPDESDRTLGALGDPARRPGCRTGVRHPRSSPQDRKARSGGDRFDRPAAAVPGKSITSQSGVLCAHLLVQGVSETLDERHGATLRGPHAEKLAGAPPKLSAQGAHEDIQDISGEARVVGQAVTQREWQRQDPLPHRYHRKNAIDQMSRRIRHAPSTTRRTPDTRLTGKGQQAVLAAVRTMKP